MLPARRRTARGPSTVAIPLGLAPMRMRRACTGGGIGPTIGAGDSTAAHRSTEASAKSRPRISLLAEVPVAAGAGGIRPIPAHVHRGRRRHGIGGNDAAKDDAIEAASVVGLLNPRPDRPHDFGGVHGHGGPLRGCDTGLSGCDGDVGLPGRSGDRSLPGRDGSRSNRSVTGPDRDAPMCACDAMGSDSGAAMANRDAAGCGATSA